MTSNLPIEKLRLQVEKKWIEHVKLCQDNFLYFVHEIWQDFICRKEKDPEKWGHHQIIAHEFTKIASERKGRLIINMPPRHTKSEFASVYFPAWIIGKYPKLKIMQVSHNTELAVRFGSKVRNIIDSPEYKQIFGDVKLREDSKAKGRWETNQGGEYYAAGVGASITGRGADLLIIDDPHTEQDSMSDMAMSRAYDWYTSGPRQRLQPGGSILLVMTRWAEDDLTGRLIKAQTEPKADKWKQISFPAILKSGNPVWPEYWELEELEKIKSSVPIRNWSAQYMQEPTSEEGGAPHMILLDALRGKFDFPELKAVALDANKYWEPETIVIEQKASGEPLTQEFRRMGIPVVPFVPTKGNDKHTRVNVCAPVFESGQVWYPYGEKFAEDVIEECAAFPNGANDDYVDSTTQAVLRYRQGNFVELYTDLKDDIDLPPKEYRYYE